MLFLKYLCVVLHPEAYFLVSKDSLGGVFVKKGNIKFGLPNTNKYIQIYIYIYIYLFIFYLYIRNENKKEKHTLFPPVQMPSLAQQ